MLRPGDRAGALRAGIGYIPEDRQAEGFVPLLGVAENIAMTITDRISRAGLVSPRRREERAAPLARRLSLVSAGLGQPVRELSGGNQQKVTVARALASDPALIVAITPTRGVDVASKELLLAELDRITAADRREPAAVPATSWTTWPSATACWCWSAARSSPSSPSRPSTAKP